MLCPFPVSHWAVAGGALLLDAIPGAVGAYSLRKLKSGVTNVIRVRRSSDDLEQDFTEDQIIDGTLTAFTGASDGFVPIWYDQEGAANMVQPTHANQPRIVSGGVLLVRDGIPQVEFDGTNDEMIATVSSFVTDNITYVFYGALNVGDNATDRRSIVSLGDGIGSTVIRYDFDAAAISSTQASFAGMRFPTDKLFELPNLDLERKICWYRKGANHQEASENGNAKTVDTNPLLEGTVTRLRMGDNFYGFNGEGALSEFVVWPSDMSAYESAIKANLNGYFAAY